MSANVSGFGNTMRITLNDNLLGRGSPEEIQSVMGHEMGHYVLNHVYKGFLFFLPVVVVVFGFLYWSLNWSLKRWGEQWQIRGIGDTAILPLAVLLGSLLVFVLTPVLNTFMQNESGSGGRMGIFRSSKRAQPHQRGHALEGGKPQAVPADGK